MAGMRPNAVLFKFVTSEDCQVALWGRKGLAETKLGLDEDLTPAQQARKSELWSLFKEAKAMGKHTFCTQSSFSSMALRFAHLPLSRGMGTRETYVWYYGTCMGVV
jgi:NADH:ubiquinone oxidoreductase subunit F (NADH-binding)